MALKLFWLKCGPRNGNFGDYLTPLLMDHLNVAYEWASADRADLIGIGSLCEKIPQEYAGAVWTSGNLFSSHCNHFAHARVLALRGKLTRERTSSPAGDAVALGDGGLLCHLLAPDIHRKRYKLGIIPHYVDERDPALHEVVSNNVDTCLIDICDEPRNVIQSVAECEYILSSSLHGLILADSLRIPNRWLEAGGKVLGEGFKFHDYYSVYSIDCPKPVRLQPTDRLDDLLPHFEDYCRPGIDAVSNRVLEKLSEFIHRDSTRPKGSATALPCRQVGNSTNSRHDSRATQGDAGQHTDSTEANSRDNRQGVSDAKSQRPGAVSGVRKRIFVVGTGRSGTCWMGELLDTHPQIRCFVEPKPVFELVTKAALDRRQEEFLLDQILNEYDRLFEDAFPFHFADKTHPLLWFAEPMAKRCADSYFIAMVREVEPTVASMLRHRGVRRWCEQWHKFPIPNCFLGITSENRHWYKRASTVERCTARWWAHRNEITRLEGLLGERFLTVKYEELVADTTTVLANVSHFLRLDRCFPVGTARSNSLSKWKAQLTLEDVESIRHALSYLSESSQLAI